MTAANNAMHATLKCQSCKYGLFTTVVILVQLQVHPYSFSNRFSIVNISVGLPKVSSVIGLLYSAVYQNMF